MPPPKGMVPPKLGSEEEPRLRPGDTRSFVAQVAEELVEEVERHRAEQAAAAAAAEPEPQKAAVAPAATSAPTTQTNPRPLELSFIPVPGSSQATPTNEPKRRGKLLGVAAIGVAAVIGLVVWINAGGKEETPTRTAAATVTPAPEAPKPEGDAAAEPPAPSPAPVADDVKAAGEPVAPEPVPEPVPAVDASTGAPEAAASEGDAGEGSAALPDEPEPVEAASDPEGSSTRKSSGKRSGGSSKKPAGDGGAKPEPAPASKPEEAPTAAKLLKQARAAYQAGRGASAYSLASKSNRMEPSGAAAEVMALAACQMKDADKAKAALRTVPLFSRTSVRNTCKTKHGVKLGI
jgi:hypothetical protein